MDQPILTDFHMHSTYSPDGDDSPETMCRHALSAGMSAIALTEHAEWHPTHLPNGFSRVDEYFRAVDRCRQNFTEQGLAVYSGVELGNPHEHSDQACQLLADYPFEVVIASLHWLDGKNIHLEECFSGRDIYDVYRHYFRELGRLASGFDFDILAHWDRIIWRGTLLGDQFDPWRIEDEIKESLTAIVAHNRTLELNTRFIGEPVNWNEAIITVFRWFVELGGHRFVIDSDAHRRHEIGRDFAIATQLLTRAGIPFSQAVYYPASATVRY
jgi:histidinol-phosphatase (PHP family)